MEWGGDRPPHLSPGGAELLFFFGVVGTMPRMIHRQERTHVDGGKLGLVTASLWVAGRHKKSIPRQNWLLVLRAPGRAFDAHCV